jgi:hypothetical protein
MIAKERMYAETAPRTSILHVVPTAPGEAPSVAEPSLLWRLVLVFVGVGLAMAGWALVLTVLLSFIGLPIFMFGVALIQAQER